MDERDIQYGVFAAITILLWVGVCAILGYWIIDRVIKPAHAETSIEKQSSVPKLQDRLWGAGDLRIRRGYSI